ncbi:MAG: tetratricopeptide repeat protein [Bryobacteraceae bacterium]|nr:tetratricopeptide repeat protein [Bryobacteraceae bacterium]MDW8378984.1 tetratricopeptide repeat protein [Bryobacterales bacterium]
MPNWLFLVIVALVLNSAYLWALPSPTIFYMANVVLHLVLGLIVCAALRVKPAVWWMLASAIPAAYLVVGGNTREHAPWLLAHIVLALVAVACLIRWAFSQRGARLKLLGFASALLVFLPAGAKIYRRLVPNPGDRIVNPIVTPVSMEQEGEGPSGLFWPSSARTTTGKIPSSYFMDSEQCGSCHKDIYEQWKSSVHHFASFNNQFYRKSIEYMQEIQGSTQPSRWCAACHDHAILFAGKWDRPIREQIDTPEAHAGLGCTSCHSIIQVHNTMGNAAFTLDYNWLHEIAASKNKYVQALDRFLTFLNPEPHRRTFLKPFHRLDVSEFCSSCHKVHLDVPVNNYRWIRGFNDYDNWQASGVSGRGARSFYYPAKPATCSTCHMPLVPSKDPGNQNGMVHSHRFPGANTAVPFVNGDQVQLEETKKFLQSGFLTVDIFAASPLTATRDVKMIRRAEPGPHTALTSFAVGEEAESAGQVFLREVGKVAAPLDHSEMRLEPGSTVRVDVVVRTRKIGHFFPGGTVDAFDVWVEFEAFDAEGKHIFWSGRVEEDGRGPVEKGAHFYRSYQLDAEGNPINKRNAWQTRSVLYVRLIPPGAADTVHYLVRIPKSAKAPLTFRAKVNYRKFMHYYTQFAYAGQPVSGQPASLFSLNHDSRQYFFSPTNIPRNVSGAMKDRIPDLPVITLAQQEIRVALGKPEWKQVTDPKNYERWNDWGIGMLLQGDLKGAEYAFRRVMESKPDYADGPLNLARALIQEGETEAARPFVARALELAPGLARAHFFQAMIDKAAGDYDGALSHLAKVASQYPEDRVVLNQIGRILFLKRDFAKAVAALERVLRVDPEDLQAHYTLMLAFRGLGDLPKAEYHAKLFQRFKADESAQTITAKPRLLSPEDNNERQPIHDHESAPLP